MNHARVIPCLVAVLLAVIGFAAPASAAASPTSTGTPGNSPASAAPSAASGDYSVQTANICADYPSRTHGCFYVRGADLTVSNALAVHSYTGTACNVSALFTGTRENGQAANLTITLPGCYSNRAEVQWSNPGVFKRGTNLCARIKDSLTSGSFGPSMCARIG